MAASNFYPLDGGCDCGLVRYRMETQPLFVHCCHCRWCQRESGASFAVNAMIEADRVVHLSSEPEITDTPRAAAKAKRSRAAQSAELQYGATTRGRFPSSGSFALERLTRRIICHRIYTFSLLPNKHGLSFGGCSIRPGILRS